MVVAETEGGDAIYVRGRVRRMLGELTGVEAHPHAITLAKNPVLHDQSKHIDVKFYFLRDCVDGGQIVIEFVETARQLADVLTKPLGRLQLTELKEMIGMERVQGLAVGLKEDC